MDEMEEYELKPIIDNLQFADKLRKSIAKKNPKEYEALTKTFFEKVKTEGLDENFCDYVWNTEIALSRGYGFNASHTYAYSIIALQEMNLAYKYPIIFWNTANLIVDSGGIQNVTEDDMIIVDDAPDEDADAVEEEEQEEWEEENETTFDVGVDKKKKKNKTVDYGKVASAIGKFKSYGIEVAPPDINNSSYTFTPDVKNNQILYGLRGITRLSSDLINSIIVNRPYTSLDDFLTKVKVNKTQIINLIKCGAFDAIEHKSREQTMREYISSIVDVKSDLNLRNMQMLITQDLIPPEMLFYGKLFSFNKFLKTCKDGDYYKLNPAAINFISLNFDADLIENGEQISQKVWDNVYKKGMEPMKTYIKMHKEELLDALNNKLYDEVANKYAQGSISRWEMESVSFYSHKHELADAAVHYDDFFQLPAEPEVDYSFVNREGQVVNILKLHKIVGTVIDKNKIKNTVTLLTPSGVVTVKVYKNQYAMYDKQLSQVGADGKKHVQEKSWFSRGSLLMVQGIKRGSDFIPKKRKDSYYPVISKIIQVNDDGTLEFQTERMEVD